MGLETEDIEADMASAMQQPRTGFQGLKDCPRVMTWHPELSLGFFFRISPSVQCTTLGYIIPWSWAGQQSGKCNSEFSCLLYKKGTKRQYQGQRWRRKKQIRSFKSNWTVRGVKTYKVQWTWNTESKAEWAGSGAVEELLFQTLL